MVVLRILRPLNSLANCPHKLMATVNCVRFEVDRAAKSKGPMSRQESSLKSTLLPHCMNLVDYGVVFVDDAVTKHIVIGDGVTSIAVPIWPPTVGAITFFQGQSDWQGNNSCTILTRNN